MGDRYIYSLKKCSYCGAENSDIWISPTSNVFTFNCEKCNKSNFIDSGGDVKKTENVTLDDVEISFLESTNAMWTEKQIKNICKDSLRQIRS